MFDEPGTTRDVVTAETALDGWPVELIDTAGIRGADEALESVGIERARAALHSADCRLLLLDVGQPLDDADHALLREVADAIVVAHKCDLPATWDASSLGNVNLIAVSSRTGAGIEALQAAIVERLVPEVPAPNTAIPLTERQVAMLQDARESIQRGGSETQSDAHA